MRVEVWGLRNVILYDIVSQYQNMRYCFPRRYIAVKARVIRTEPKVIANGLGIFS